MPKLWYETTKLGAEKQAIVNRANSILDEYAAQGYTLTLRQLYYQFVARGLIPNKDTEYKRLGSIVADARMNGWIDWEAIIDRTRNLRSLSHWDEPSDLMEAAARQFRQDLWRRQDNYTEVWIEKDALVGVIEGICEELDVPFFSCRGYTSASEMWAASQRLLKKVQAGRQVTILHLGDHDPSGLDMTRDISDRLFRFLLVDLARHAFGEDDEVMDEAVRDAQSRLARQFEVRRIALTMDQIEEFNPPPNPAKITDSRARGYIEEYGDSSWELDALDPATLSGLIEEEVRALINDEQWDEDQAEMEEKREQLSAAADRWDEVVDALA